MTSRVIKVAPDGIQTEVAVLPSLYMGQATSGGSRIVLVDGVPYVTSGGYIRAPEDERPPLFAAVARIEDGESVEVANTWAFEAENNPDGFAFESHPYDITADDEGNLWVADAGANDLLEIDAETDEIELVTVFPGIPGLPFPNENRCGAMELDPVPTGVVVADDGTIYVSYLPGFPPIPGGKVVTVDSETDEVSDYATNVTVLTDLVMGPDDELYAVHMADFGEQGPAPGTGSVIRIREGDASEQIVGGLPFPTAIDFDAEGNAYVTINGVGLQDPVL
jgi:sugar lactone lactonase YvrE